MRPCSQSYGDISTYSALISLSFFFCRSWKHIYEDGGVVPRAPTVYACTNEEYVCKDGHKKQPESGRREEERWGHIPHDCDPAIIAHVALRLLLLALRVEYGRGHRLRGLPDRAPSHIGGLYDSFTPVLAAVIPFAITRRRRPGRRPMRRRAGPARTSPQTSSARRPSTQRPPGSSVACGCTSFAEGCIL
ncbi:hypothetical protein LY78DRAFT_390009 [Colletotrichum sublineola]|nr:hypothetical protein LY78DRAFT_390009 [Colletotrichum sublineola]